MSAYEAIPCTECGAQTIAARPVCSLCEADQGLFAPLAAPAPADPEFARWWMTPDSRTGHAPSASLDLGSAQKAWAAARAIPAAAPTPASNCPMKALLDRLESPDPAVRAEAEAQAERAAENVQRVTPRAAPLPVAQAVSVPGGTFEPVGNVWHERVNDEYHATLDDEKVSDGEPLYRFVAGPDAVAAPVLEDGLDADDITRLREALNWMGESTYESHEECSIFRVRLIRRLISATLASRDAVRVARDAEVAAAATGMFKDHEIRDFVNRLRDVSIQFHHTQQLRSRIQDIVLPLLTRDRTA